MNLVAFRIVQEEFSAVVKEALTYGPDPVLSEKFRQTRAQLQSKYPDVRPSFDRVWTTSVDPRRFHGQHTDPIETILDYPTLDGFLKRDAKQILKDLDDIQTAFDLCGDTEVSVA